MDNTVRCVESKEWPSQWQGNVKVQGMCIFFLIMPSHIVWISGRFKMVYIDGAYDSKG